MRAKIDAKGRDPMDTETHKTDETDLTDKTRKTRSRDVAKAGAGDAAGAVVLEVSGLTVDINRAGGGALRAVDSVDLVAHRGETVALLGESGCGKSMTARGIVGLLEPVAEVTAGVVRVEETDLIAASNKTRRKMAGPAISIVFQDALTALNPVYTVGVQLGEPFRIHQGLNRKQARLRAIELMERVGIPEPKSRVDSYPHEFSGGMRQRLLIAMAVALGPSVLVADEPTTALDVTVQAQIMRLIKDLQAENHMAVVLITHDLALVAEDADTTIVMYSGVVVEKGPARDVFADPRHPYTKGLLASLPEHGEAGQTLLAVPGSPPALADVPTGCVYQDRCPLVRERCRESRPPLVEVAPGRASACFYPMEVSNA